jgi:hypothetical protein
MPSSDATALLVLVALAAGTVVSVVGAFLGLPIVVAKVALDAAFIAMHVVWASGVSTSAVAQRMRAALSRQPGAPAKVSRRGIHGIWGACLSGAPPGRGRCAGRGRPAGAFRARAALRRRAARRPAARTSGQADA